MDWTTIAVTVVSSLVPTGGLAGLLLFKENKRSKQLENETTASQQWRELYDKAEAKVDAQGLKIESLYKENKLLRDDNNALSKQNAVLKIFKCDAIECLSRKPPFGSKQNNDKQ